MAKRIVQEWAGRPAERLKRASPKRKHREADADSGAAASLCYSLTSSAGIGARDDAAAGGALPPLEWIPLLRPLSAHRLGDRLPNGERCTDADYAHIKKRRRLESELGPATLRAYMRELMDLVGRREDLYYYPIGEGAASVDIFYAYTYRAALYYARSVMNALEHLLQFLASKDSAGATSQLQSLDRLSIDCEHPETCAPLDAIVARFDMAVAYVSERISAGRFTTDQYLLHALLGLDDLLRELTSLDVMFFAEGSNLLRNRRL